MTQCAPKQLSACLPQIVPRLLTVLLESQPQLRQAGGKALTQIGGVIRNPEVQGMWNIGLHILFILFLFRF
ncbi:unnamed protein product [Protopolystoma xenopodis]|uniref:TOG domain-containing protein n=1 Tax=Protopolystoma xenopodis TaxID=117903 RepID=A0A448XQF3_9PLAT|nr:unnamed protein product [Protopolystoma xenopodis]